ncbi:MAG: medium chain dehydrogenase/reductase family protein [Bacillota bacterium]
MKYQRVVMTALGAPDVLEVVEEEMVSPRAGEVRVRVLAAGVAYADIMMRHGRYPGMPQPPFTPGYDLVGEVEEVGAGVERFRPGERVAALTVRGGYAQQVILPVDELVSVPDGVDPAEAASLTLNYVSAYQMLHRVARVEPGERVLIHGAAGGVGTALLQLGRLHGLELYGTASAAKHDLVRQMGAIPIDHRNEDFVTRLGGGVDAAFDGIGGRTSWRSFRALRRGGRLICYGFRAAQGAGPLVIPLTMMSVTFLNLAPGRRTGFYAIASWKKRHSDWFRADLAVLLQLLAERQIAPVVAERLPLREAARAHALLERSAVSGKLVLLPNG